MADIPVRVIIDAIDNASAKIKGVGMSLEDFGSNLQKVGAAGLAIGGITALVTKGFIEQAGAMEQNQIAFTTMLGSAEKANVLLKQMSDFAARTPFNLPDIVNAGKQLLAYGTAQGDVIKTTEMLGNVASGLGIPLGDLVYLYGTLQVQQRAYTKDLIQFTNRGVDVITPLANQFGVTKDKVFDLASEGKISFADIQKAFQGMTSEGGKFFNLMDKQSKSTLGVWSNFQDAITRLQIAMGNALLPTVTAVLNGLIPFLTKIGEFAKQHPGIVKGLVAMGLAIGVLGAVLFAVGTVITPILAFFALLPVAMAGITAAAGVLGAVLAVVFSPVTLIILAIVAAIALLALAWKNNWGDIQGKTKAVVSFLVSAFQNTIAAIQQFIGLVVSAWNTATEAIVNFVNAVTTFFAQLPVTIANIWSGIVTAFQNAIAAIGAALAAIPGIIMAILTTVGVALYDFFFTQLPFALGFAAGAIVKFFTVDIPAAWNALIAFFTVTVPALAAQFLVWITDMTVNAALAIFNFATVSVPQAINSMIAYLATAIPAMVTAFVGWITNLKNQVVAGFNSMVQQTIAFMTSMWQNAVRIATNLYNDIVSWITSTVRDVGAWLSKLPGVIAEFFNQGKERANSIMQDMYNTVKGWYDGIVNFLKGIIDWANNAINKVREAATAGFNAGKRQFGGAVNPMNPVVVGEAGAEVFVPQTAGTIIPAHQVGKGGGGTTIQFIINSSMIINSPQERRTIAEALYKDLVVLAQSMNMSVAEMLGA